MTAPLVSAVITCYRHERYIEECLDSVLTQGYPNLQLVITDDCSPDASAERIEAWLARNHVKADFVRHGRNRGVAATVNHGIARSRGDLVALLSSDDAWLPGHLARSVRIMEGLPPSDAAVYSDAVYMDEEGGELPDLFIGSHRRGLEPPSGHIRPHLIEGNFIPGMTLLMRREAVRAVGGYDAGQFYEDWEFYLRLAGKYGFRYSGGVGAKYRVCADSLTATLIAPRGDDLLLGHVRMFRKVLDWQDPAPAEARRLREKIAEVAHEFWMRGSPGLAEQCAAVALNYGWSWRPLAVYLLARAGVSHHAVSRAKGAVFPSRHARADGV